MVETPTIENPSDSVDRDKITRVLQEEANKYNSKPNQAHPKAN